VLLIEEYRWTCSSFLVGEFTTSKGVFKGKIKATVKQACSQFADDGGRSSQSLDLYQGLGVVPGGRLRAGFCPVRSKLLSLVHDNLI